MNNNQTKIAATNPNLSNVKLVTTESFEGLVCNVYQNINNEIFLTRKQIGEALEYENPDDAIYRIHERHKDRLDKFSLHDYLSSQDGRMINTILYTEQGVMEICRWSRKPKANDLMDWIYAIGIKYYHGELVPICNNQNNQYDTLIKRIELLEKEVAVLQAKQTRLEISLPTSKPYSAWSTKMYPKYQLLLKYSKIDSFKVLYKELYTEFANLHPNIDLSKLMSEYCKIHHVDRCFTLEAIEENPEVRDLFENMANNLLGKYDLLAEQAVQKKTIFTKNKKQK